MDGAHAQQATKRPWACKVSKQPLKDDHAQARNKGCPCNALIIPYLPLCLVLLNQHKKVIQAARRPGNSMAVRDAQAVAEGLANARSLMTSM